MTLVHEQLNSARHDLMLGLRSCATFGLCNLVTHLFNHHPPVVIATESSFAYHVPHICSFLIAPAAIMYSWYIVEPLTVHFTNVHLGMIDTVTRDWMENFGGKKCTQQLMWTCYKSVGERVRFKYKLTVMLVVFSLFLLTTESDVDWCKVFCFVMPK